ncbi:hypothetical protein D1J51_09545 [Leucobacter sp. wl10]|nr:hypothetical protein D1J51_09545 [Leucobacter sp. wl10]
MSTTVPPADGVTWAMVEDGFYVGSRDGEFLGYIDREAESRYVACNMYSRPAGAFRDLGEAMEALRRSSALQDGTGEDE